MGRGICHNDVYVIWPEACMKVKKNKLFYFLVLAIAAYVIKNLFVGADTDEGYGIYVGYRLVMGDKLLLEMWEPHQTSAIFTALFIKPFLMLTGGNLDFLNLYLRVVYFIIHGLITALMYHTMKKCMPQVDSKVALGLSLVYFVSSPKSIYVPEYSNLNVWFFTLLCICFIWYYSEASVVKGRLIMLVMAGFALTCNVLSYPSMVLLFPFCLLLTVARKEQKSWKQCVAFAAPCIISALALLLYILSYMSFEQILQVIPCVLSDGSHQVGIAEKLQMWAKDIAETGLVFLVSAIVSLIIVKVFKCVSERKNPDKETEPFSVCFLVVFFVLQIIIQFYYWFTSLYNAAYPHQTYLALMLLGIYCYCKSGKTEKAGFYIIILSLIQYIGVVVLSNWKPMLLFSYFIVGALGGFLCWNSYFVKYSVRWKQQLTHILCGVLIISNVFGYCYLIIGGSASNSPIWEVSGYIRDGFRKGILTGYMTSYRYNMNNDIWQEAVPDGSTVLYVGPSQYFSMLGDSVIATPNTISTPVYDENLLAYWEMNPDRYPNVVAVESWFGEIRYVEEDSFIMKWLEEEFQATEVIEYPYITVYRK